MKLRCASCGWRDEVVHAGGPGMDLAQHLRVCPERDDARYVPGWAVSRDGVFECAWTTRVTLAGVLALRPGWDHPDADPSKDIEDVLAVSRMAGLPGPAWHPFADWAERDLIGIRGLIVDCRACYGAGSRAGRPCDGCHGSGRHRL